MSYKTYNYDSNFDDNSLRFVGWNETIDGDKTIEKLFSHENIQNMSRKITELLQGVNPDGRDIIVTDRVISAALSDIYENTTREYIGGIYTKNNIILNEPRNDFREMVNQTIGQIVGYVRNESEMIENNNKLTIWTTILGDFNKEGLRSHPPIKILKNHPQHMAFNMNY